MYYSFFSINILSIAYSILRTSSINIVQLKENFGSIQLLFQFLSILFINLIFIVFIFTDTVYCLFDMNEFCNRYIIDFVIRNSKFCSLFIFLFSPNGCQSFIFWLLLIFIHFWCSNNFCKIPNNLFKIWFIFHMINYILRWISFSTYLSFFQQSSAFSQVFIDFNFICYWFWFSMKKIFFFRKRRWFYPFSVCVINIGCGLFLSCISDFNILLFRCNLYFSVIFTTNNCFCIFQLFPWDSLFSLLLLLVHLLGIIIIVVVVFNWCFFLLNNGFHSFSLPCFWLCFLPIIKLDLLLFLCFLSLFSLVGFRKVKIPNKEYCFLFFSTTVRVSIITGNNNDEVVVIFLHFLFNLQRTTEIVLLSFTVYSRFVFVFFEDE